MIETSSPIKPPAKDHSDDKLRAFVEASVAPIPLASSITRLVKELLPTQGEKARNAWEIAITNRINEHSDRISEHIERVDGLAFLIDRAAAMDERKADCARDLAFLAFWNDGIRGPLEKIATGNGDQADLKQIQELLLESESDVKSAVDRLIKARDDLIEREYSMPMARAIDSVMWRKVGPGAIRDKLRNFTTFPAGNAEQVKWDAQILVQEINSFDNDVSQIHAAIKAKN